MLPIIAVSKAARSAAVSSTPVDRAINKNINTLASRAKPVSACSRFTLRISYGPGFGSGEMLVKHRNDGVIEVLECYVPLGLDAPVFSTPFERESVEVSEEDLMDMTGEIKVMQICRDSVTGIARVQMSDTIDEVFTRMHWVPMVKLYDVLIARNPRAQQAIGQFTGVWLKFVPKFKPANAVAGTYTDLRSIEQRSRL